MVQQEKAFLVDTVELGDNGDRQLSKQLSESCLQMAGAIQERHACI